MREDILAEFVLWCRRKDVRYICAFMEAEWDLTRLELDGVIDAIVSEDSDFFVLGSKVLIQLLDINIAPDGVNCSAVMGSCWQNFTESEYSREC